MTSDHVGAITNVGEIPGTGEKSRPLRFLVADDNGVNRRVAALLLEHHGHLVRTARDGDEAITMVQHEPFDCVLMDVQMPGIDGLEATRRIREREARDGGHLAILAMSATSLADDRERCMAAGMDDCVGKPLAPQDAVATATRVIESVRAGGVRRAGLVPPPLHQVVRTGRMPAGELKLQHDLVMAAPGIREVLDRLPQPVFLIGSYRQIVYANPAAAWLMPAMTRDEAIGHRPGEALGCRHSNETTAGCGTSKFCVTCGAAKALRAGQRQESATEECRITSKTAGQDLDIRVWAAPMVIGGKSFSLFTIMDISDDKRRQVLERVFLHDVLNIAGGIQGLASVCKDATAAERQAMADTVARLASVLIDELRAQQALAAAEHGELQVRLDVLSSAGVLEDAAERYRSHDVARGRTIALAPGAADVAVISDATLLGRVIGNMTKNALEACPEGGIVTLGCHAGDRQIEFSVHNPTAIPRTVQLQMFQRSFSTKGAGRGLGTYSMRLLSERYLGGAVSFSSSPEQGTTFRASYPIAGPPHAANAAAEARR